MFRKNLKIKKEIQLGQDNQTLVDVAAFVVDNTIEVKEQLLHVVHNIEVVVAVVQVVDILVEDIGDVVGA